MGLTFKDITKLARDASDGIITPETYSSCFRDFIEGRYGLNMTDDNQLLTYVRKTACLIRSEAGWGLPGTYDINLGVHARNIRRYYNIHKSKEARNAYLLLIAHRHYNYVVQFKYIPEYFYPN